MLSRPPTFTNPIEDPVVLDPTLFLGAIPSPFTHLWRVHLAEFLPILWVFTDLRTVP